MYEELYAAMDNNDLLASLLLLRRIPDINMCPKPDKVTILYKACKVGMVDVVSRALYLGAYVNARTVTHATAAHAASYGGEVECLELLVQHNADLTAKLVNWNTPLHVAAQFSNSACIKLLLDSGAQPDVINIQGDTPYDLAIKCGSSNECIALLQDAIKRCKLSTR